MIMSMTGFGKGEAASAERKITVEIKSLNSKQLDLFVKSPSFLREAELKLRSELAARLGRGKVEASITVENLTAQPPVSINVEVVKKYQQQIMAMANDLKIAWPSDWYSTLLRLPEALHSDAVAITEADLKALSEACVEAVRTLTDFRKAEGAKLQVFFEQKIAKLRDLLARIAPFEESRVRQIRERLEQELEKLRGVDYDRGRLEQELIFYIEKLDVTEEKTRLTAHLDYFVETMGGASSSGKKLGFIAQEMGREINTLGSKSNDAGMQRVVVMMKDELEQIKEQVLNVL